MVDLINTLRKDIEYYEIYLQETWTIRQKIFLVERRKTFNFVSVNLKFIIVDLKNVHAMHQYLVILSAEKQKHPSISEDFVKSLQ